ncbi:MAG: phosphopantothenate/pantothenate synthetase [Coleofasciculaceae cyanobacterium]
MIDVMSDVPVSHPRALSLKLREKIEHYRQVGIVAAAGPIAHGRGEAFDYLLGEETPLPVKEDIYTAAALLLEAKHPVISVNGNTAVLAPNALISLAREIPAKLEVNVFYGRTQERERKIAEYLFAHGAEELLGINPKAKVPNLCSSRQRVDRKGIALADLVLVSLEDGDRTNALRAWGKKVISIDLNPLSRTAIDATLNICDNVIRALPLLEEAVKDLRNEQTLRQEIIANINNNYSTARILKFLNQRLKQLASEKSDLSLVEGTEEHIEFLVNLTKSVVEEGFFSTRKEMLKPEEVSSRLSLENTFIYILKCQRDLCGFLHGEIREDGKFYLPRFAIDKQFRGLGGGNFLLKKAEEIAKSRGCSKMIIEILTNCHAAQALCLRHGYTPEAFIKANANKCNFLVLVKNI